LLGAPKFVRLYGGLSENVLEPLGCLSLLPSSEHVNGFLKLFKIDLLDVQLETSQLELALLSIKSQRLRFLTFQIGKTDSSLPLSIYFSSQQKVNVSFLSIKGLPCELAPKDLSARLAASETETSYRLLKEIFGRTDCEGVFRAIANSETMLQIIENYFELLSASFLRNEQLTSPMLIVLSKFNE